MCRSIFAERLLPRISFQSIDLLVVVYAVLFMDKKISYSCLVNKKLTLYCRQSLSFDFTREALRQTDSEQNLLLHKNPTELMVTFLSDLCPMLVPKKSCRNFMNIEENHKSLCVHRNYLGCREQTWDIAELEEWLLFKSHLGFYVWGYFSL